MPERLPDDRVPKRQVVLYPDPVLRRKAQPVKSVDAAVRELVEDMFLVMELEDGAGLAAPQVGESVRIFVTGAHERGVPRKAYINPVLVEVGGDFEWVNGSSGGCSLVIDDVAISGS